MNTIFTLAKYDYLQRVRSYQFLIISCASLAFAYVLIPAPGDTYSTIRIGEYIGNYNSAWIAYVTAIMASVFVSLMGYYLVNNSIRIDQNNKVGQIVAATSISNFHYLLAKFLGNLLILLTIMVFIFLVGILLFFMHGSGYPFEIGQFLMAYLLIPLPTIVLISAMAILLEVIFKERSVLQNVVFFFLYCFMLLQGSQAGLNGDPFGVGMPSNEMENQLSETTSTDKVQELNIGFMFTPEPVKKRFDFTGVTVSPTFLILRFLWLSLGIVLVYISSRIFHRFELPEQVAKGKKTPQPEDFHEVELQEIDFAQLPRLERSMSILPVFKAELLMMSRKGKKWLWALNLIGMVLLATIPLEFAHKIVLPILWFLQVHRWADLVTKEKSHHMHYFIFSSFNPVKRLLTSQWLAAFTLAVVLALPLVLRYVLLGDFLLAGCIITGALFIIALSSFIGIVTEGKRLFEILFFFITYMNVNGLPFTDYFGAINQSSGYLMLLAALTIGLVFLSFLFRQWELKRV